MDLGLKTLFGAAPSRGRLAACIGVVAVVIAMHAVVTRGVLLGMAAEDADDAMPARIEVAYVRDMTLAEPPPMAAPAAPPPLAAYRPKPRPAKPAKPASAPDEVLQKNDEPVVAIASTAVPASDPPPAPEPAIAAMASAESASAADENAQTVRADAAPAASGLQAASASAAAASGAVANFEWPASTRISYLLTGNYRGEVSGSGQVEWVRAGSRYQVHVDLLVGPSGAPLITRRMSSDGEITAEGLVPRRYDQETKVMFRERRHVSMAFEPGTVVLANGDRRDTSPGIQDTASQFVQLTYVFSTRPDLLKTGGTVDIPLALPHKVDVWTYDVVGEETLYPPWGGALRAIHLKPQKKNLNPNSLSAEIWFAPQLRYLPVRILIRQDEGNFVDMMVARPPELGG